MNSKFSFEEGDLPYSNTGSISIVKTVNAKKGEVETTKKAASSSAAAPSPPVVAVTVASGGNVAELEAQIEKQGKLIVSLKAAKAPEHDIKKEVEKLLALKNQLPEGHAQRPVSRADKKKQEKEDEKKPGGKDRDEEKRERTEQKVEEADKEKLEQLRAFPASPNYGVLVMVQSRPEDRKKRQWTLIGDLKDLPPDSNVLIRGYVHAIKSASSATFLVVRQRMHTIQCVIESGADVKAFVDKIPIESVVDVEGVVVAADVKSTTVKTKEVKLRTCFVVQLARVKLPFQPREAERPPPEEGSEEAEGKKPTKNILQDVRLNNRTLDLRTPAMQAIARISDGVIRLFAEYLRSEGFVEIMTPKLLAGASEGGAEVFKTDYFGRVACLAQSPQLHKQMCAACSGFERVFEIGPVFRAEKSLTARHMTEFHGLDVEMAILEHYHEMLDVFSNLFYYIFDGLNRDFQAELAVVRAFAPFEDLKYRVDGVSEKKALVLTFQEAIELLAADTDEKARVSKEDIAKLRELSKESDPSTPVEKRLGALVKQKYGVDFFMLDKYPLAVRPFYTMPDPINPKLSNSYDFFIRGQEILSGAQRVHDVGLLRQKVEEKGIPIESLRFYIDSFKDGALPHAGGGIGLERVVMLFLGIPNIRWAALFTRDPLRLVP